MTQGSEVADQGVVALAGATYISSSGIIARLLGDLRRLGNRETPSILSVLVLEDFAMAAYLPLVAVLASGGLETARERRPAIGYAMVISAAPSRLSAACSCGVSLLQAASAPTPRATASTVVIFMRVSPVVTKAGLLSHGH